jgi:hypothetical protein
MLHLEMLVCVIDHSVTHLHCCCYCCFAGGLMLYLEMLVYVIRLGHPVVVVEYKHVAMRLR